MSQIQSIEKHDLKPAEINPYFAQIHLNTSNLDTVLLRLYHRENEIFNRIIIAIKTKDNTQSIALASELLRIRILKRNIYIMLELSYNYNSRHSG